MNKKPVRTGPRIRMTRSTNRLKKLNDPPSIQSSNFDDSKYIYSCQYCRIRFARNSDFFRHMTTNHEMQKKQETFECNECQIVFSKKSSLDVHCQTNHQNKSKSKCDTCAITFKSRYCLRRHIKLKQILQENACVKCHKKCMSKDRLAKHMQNNHGVKYIAFQCDICYLKFRVKESLQSHLKRIHKL